MTGLKRIILIDDDPDDQLFFRDAMQAICPGLHCDLVSTCQEGLRQLELPPLPDYLFMDLNMPIMNGFDCLAHLKNRKEYRTIPVVVFTTSKNRQDIARTRQLGARWYLTKPDDFHVLCNKLNRIIQQDSLEGQYIV